MNTHELRLHPCDDVPITHVACTHAHIYRTRTLVLSYMSTHGNDLRIEKLSHSETRRGSTPPTPHQHSPPSSIHHTHTHTHLASVLLLLLLGNASLPAHTTHTQTRIRTGNGPNILLVAAALQRVPRTHAANNSEKCSTLWRFARFTLHARSIKPHAERWSTRGWIF